MWLIFNKFFGWHYIEYRDSADSFVARVHKIPNGEWRMKAGLGAAHYNANLKMDGTFVGRSGNWIPLTWCLTDKVNE